MALYQTNELIFDLPDSLKDKTHHIFSLTDDGPSPFTLVISRHSVAVDETLNAYGDRLIGEMRKALPAFELQDRTLTLVAGEPALRLAYHWGQNGQKLHQIQVTVFRIAALNRKQAIQFTATGHDDISPDWQSSFAQIVASIRLNKFAEAVV